MTTKMPTLRKNGFFQAVLLNSDTLEGICGEYLHTNPTPNIAGLCARLGTTPNELRRIFAIPETEVEAPSRESLSILANTIMRIEDTLVSGGLTGSYNAHMAKFILSAMHERHEKSLHETQSDNRVTITVQSHTPVDLAELRELDRLERAIEEQETIELAAMGRLPVPDEEIDPEDDECLI